MWHDYGNLKAPVQFWESAARTHDSSCKKRYQLGLTDQNYQYTRMLKPFHPNHIFNAARSIIIELFDATATIVVVVVVFSLFAKKKIQKKFIFSLFSAYFQISSSPGRNLKYSTITLILSVFSFISKQMKKKKESRKWAASVDEDPVWQIY